MPASHPNPRGLDHFDYHCYTCHKTRNFGAASLRCDIEAGKHVQRFPDHEVVTRLIKITHRFTGHQNNLELFPTKPLDEIPF